MYIVHVGQLQELLKLLEEVTVKDAKDVSEEANVENDDTVGNILTLVMSDVQSEYVTAKFDCFNCEESFRTQ